MITKTFDSWDTDDIERTFHLRRTFDSSILQSWIDVPTLTTLDATTRQNLEALRLKLQLYVDGWNEDELKFHFIAPLISIIDFSIERKNVHSFTQRTLTATVGDVQMTGRVDFIVATGKTKPIQPFFFLHEYKKEFASNSDPRAQLLAEMLAARELNAIEYPMYGCYVVGRMWFFVVLEGNTYAQSSDFSASGEDIFQIIAILTEAKRIIGTLADDYA
jgi:hypothetical protein